MEDVDLKILPADALNDLVCVIVGTRPGIVKQSPLIRALHAQKVPYFVVHTGQHYSYEMDRQFFEDLELAQPNYRVEGVRPNQLHGEQTAEMLRGVEAILVESRPKLVLVGGDANTNLAAALAARKLHIAVGHVEAGLRSFDWRMPEEHNRVIIDHISEYLFAPTENARRNLEHEAIRGRIHVVGNTVVDAVQQHFGIATAKSAVLSELGEREKEYLVMTVHREENTDDEAAMSRVFDVVETLGTILSMPVIFPAHPRARKRLVQFGLDRRAAQLSNLRIVDALGYLDFVRLLGSSALVLTDSGGIQQEACILRVPCITLRESTEWIETVEIGANVVTGSDPAKVVEAAQLLLDRSHEWAQPFGDGTTGAQVAAVAKEALQDGTLPTMDPSARPS